MRTNEKENPERGIRLWCEKDKEEVKRIQWDWSRKQLKRIDDDEEEKSSEKVSPDTAAHQGRALANVTNVGRKENERKEKEKALELSNKQEFLNLCPL